MEPQIALAGFFIGLLVGLTGMGGGALMTPFLILVLGVRPLLAVGTDLAFAAITKAFGAYVHARQGTVDFTIALYLALGSVPASLLGVAATVAIRHAPGADVDLFITRALGVVLVAIALVIFFRCFGVEGRVAQKALVPLPSRRGFAILVGAVVGFLVGLTSVGSGTLLVPVLILLYSLSARKVVGTDVFHAAFLTGAAGLAHWQAGNVELSLLTNLLVGSIPGIVIGSRLAAKIPDRFLRPGLALVLLVSGLRLV